MIIQSNRPIFQLSFIFLVVFFVLSVSPVGVIADLEPLEVEWNHTFGGAGTDGGASVQQTSDGGYIITGHTYSSSARLNSDVYLVKTNHTGEMQWSSTFGGPGADRGNSVQQTEDGGYIIAGISSPSGSTYNTHNVYLVKTDSGGNLMWHWTYGGNDYEVGESVIQTSDGGYIVAGSTESFGAGGRDIYLLKVNSRGFEQWSKTYGGSSWDHCRSVQETSDGGYILTASTDSFGAGNSDIYLVRTDSSGNLLWNKTYGGTDFEYGYSAQQTSDGGYIITGNTGEQERAKRDIFLIKVDSNGNLLMNMTYGGNAYDSGYSVQQTFDGGYIITGGTESFGKGYEDAYLVKTDSEGKMQWNRTFGGWHSDVGYSVQQIMDGSYILAGSTHSSGSGGQDMYLVKVGLYELSVVSRYGSISGEGNYPKGFKAIFSVSPVQIEEEDGIRKIFSGWTSPSSGGYTGSSNPVEVVVNNKIVETAEWDTLFFLDIHSDVGVDGGGWISKGFAAELNAPSHSGFLIRRVFQGWSGDVDSSSGTITIVMDGPKKVYVNWRTDYSQAALLGVGIVVMVSFLLRARKVTMMRDS